MASGFKSYPFDQIEPKWQSYWEGHKTFCAQDNASRKPKFYVLDMFPYPSAAGLHVGHLEGYTATDIIARYKRMRGFNVLHPMGWDAFGLPAEQHALETGAHPRETTQKNIQIFKRQIRRLGFSYDWDREIDTTDPGYYRWTQWIFMKLFEKGLAYEAEMPVNWCPALGTVLANEEVIDGKSERGGHPVVRRPMRQWMLKITAYAERLLSGLEGLDWPESIKEMQRNWIGKSVGAEVDFDMVCHPRESGDPRPGFPLKACGNDNIKVFTTRPDTLFGATYMVLAPEHPLVTRLTTAEQKKAAEEYIAEAARKSDLERTELAREKTGVFTGGYAVNPVNQKKIPVWIADYVLATYGTGAIMAVPAHDERDFEFAKKFGLPIVPVIRKVQSRHPEAARRRHPERSEGSQVGGPSPPGIVADQDDVRRPEDDAEGAFTGVGVCFNSTTPDKTFSIDGMMSDKAIEKITAWLEKTGKGKSSIQYKLRDWLFSRQRYWGEPIPVIHVDGKPRLIAEKDLPLKLPESKFYKPTGTGASPLAAMKDWVEVTDPASGKKARRETNTMPQWAGSCWYYLRYLDPRNQERLVDPKKEKYWMPVDLYVGGAEHAVLHLLYARFWHKVLHDCGVVWTEEPFQRLVNQGMILGEDSQKMSKSRGNVVNPDEMVDRYGADSVRLYEMFMGPLEMTKPWSTQGVEGVYRFLGRVWRLFMAEGEKLQTNIVGRGPHPSELKLLHRAIKKVTEDIEAIRLNTAISALMIFVNEKVKDPDHSREVMEKFLLLLAPFAPHLAEELWSRLGQSESLAEEPWPDLDARFLSEDQVEMAVLVAGKVRGRITVRSEAGEEEIRQRALEDGSVRRWTDGKKIQRVVVVPKRVVNIVLGK